MAEHVTLVGPPAPSDATSRVSALPPDLLDQVRGRVRLLALLLFVAFAFDPVLYLLVWIASRVTGRPVIFGNVGFMTADLVLAFASAGLWWTARRAIVSPTRLHTLGLIYEVLVCFQIAYTNLWQWWLDKGACRR